LLFLEWLPVPSLPSPLIGTAVYSYQGTAGNIPLAAAFTMGPIVIMLIYLFIARKLGAFDAL
jgi:putative spermidine/putrescine transport system permease protein